MAYCHLAAALGNEAEMGVYKNVPEVLARSMDLAQKAVNMDDPLAQAHITLGFQCISLPSLSANSERYHPIPSTSAAILWSPA